MATELSVKQSVLIASLLVFVFLSMVLLSGWMNEGALNYPAARIGSFDLIAFWSASTLFLDGANPYHLESMHQLEQSVYPGQDVVGFLNPPWALPWYALLCWLPFQSLRIVWMFLNFFSLLFMLLIGKWQGNSKIYAAALITGLWFLPALKAIWMGQVSGILTTSLLFALYCYQKEKLFLSAFFTFPALIKPHLFLPLLVWWGLVIVARDKNVRWLISFFLVVMLSMLLSYVINPHVFSFWIEVDKGPLEYRTVTLVTAIRDLILSYTGTFVYWPLYVVPLVGVIFSVLIFYRDKWPGHPDRIPLLLALSCGFAPFSFFYDYIALLPMHYVLMKRALEVSSRKRVYYLLLVMSPQLLVMLFSSLSTDASALYWFPWTYLLLYYFMSQGRRPVRQEVEAFTQ